MDTATIINIILCILSFILAARSVITVVITLLQNSKMIESSTRPYISVYHGYTYFQNMNHYLIVKNFGSSSAIITAFECDADLNKIADTEGFPPFLNLVGTSLSPGQKFMYKINAKELISIDHFTIHLEYRSDQKHSYSEDISVKATYLSDLYGTRASTENKELKIISYALQDISERLI